MSLVRTVARNSLWSGFDLIVDTVLPPIITIIVARAMGPAKLGAFSYVIWMSTVVASLGCGGIMGGGAQVHGRLRGQKPSRRLSGHPPLRLASQAIVSLLLVGAGLVWVFLALAPDERGFATLAMVSILPAGLTAHGHGGEHRRGDLRQTSSHPSPRD